MSGRSASQNATVVETDHPENNFLGALVTSAKIWNGALQRGYHDGETQKTGV